MPEHSTLSQPAETAEEIIIGQRRYRGLEALEPRYLRLVLILLSFQDPTEERRLVRFSFADFCRRAKIRPDSREAAEACQFLKDLVAGSMRVTDPATGALKQLPLFQQALIIEYDNP